MTWRRGIRARITATAGLFAALFALLAGRVAQITVIEGPTLGDKAARQHTQRVSTLAQRGEIVDRHGEPLALTRESVAVWARPKQLTSTPAPLMAMARLLDQPPAAIAEKVAVSAPFVWLDRQVPLDRWGEIERLGLAGVGSEPARQRIYPQGPVAGQVLGFLGIDGQGLEGVERSLDAELRGEVEALDVERDARGRRMAVEDGWGPLPRVGSRVELTIDAALQEVAETELEKAVEEFGAVAASAVVLVPYTGEVLAMATVPRFDPNRFGEASAQALRNRSITDSYEPGSTFKVILAAEALEAGVVAPEDRIFCEEGRYQVGNREIHDSHPHGLLSFADVIAQSSNIGSAKIAEKLGRDRFGAALERFGFGRKTGVDLPGEVQGLLAPASAWRRINLVTTAFGQGIAVTPLQLARAFAAIANGGLLLRPYVVRRIVEEDGRIRYTGRPHVERRVIAEETALRLTEILRRVVESGTGKLARIDGVAVAGKTGTAQKVDSRTKRYHPRDRMSSFVGYLPAEDPELVVLVVVDSPKKKSTYGGVVAAPVFRRIAEYALDRRGSTRSSVPYPAARPVPLLQPVFIALEVPAAHDGAAPSFIGLGMRDALVRAQQGGWRVRVEGSGYVTAQDPPPGAFAGGRILTLVFRSTLS